MSTETKLGPESQRHLDAYLDAVAEALTQCDQTDTVIQGILSDNGRKGTAKLPTAFRVSGPPLSRHTFCTSADR